MRIILVIGDRYKIVYYYKTSFDLSNEDTLGCMDFEDGTCITLDHQTINQCDVILRKADGQLTHLTDQLKELQIMLIPLYQLLRVFLFLNKLPCTQ